MIATSRGRRSLKDGPKAKRIAVTIALLLIAGLIAMLAVAIYAVNLLLAHALWLRLDNGDIFDASGLDDQGRSHRSI
jgi:hypothetical protein